MKPLLGPLLRLQNVDGHKTSELGLLMHSEWREQYSVVSFVIWEGGGGVRPPNVPTYARVSASETYIFRSQNFTSAYIYNQCSSFSLLMEWG